MSGKPRENRDLVASKHVGLRFTPSERAELQALVDETNASLEAQGMPGTMSATSMLKFLVREETKRRREAKPRRKGR